jgi:putative ABC transport system permease protein
MADYHQHGLQTKVGPVLTFINPYAYRFMAARINGKDMQSTIRQVESFWKQRFRGYPFEYFMLDDDFNLQYKTETNLARLISLFSILTILVACLGLFGLTAYITMKRTREIGIRKVLGATTGSVAGMLSKDFLKLVVIAILISVPVSWWMMNKWLEDFAYRINIPVWAFVLAGISALLIAMVTVSFQAIKAALANPVKSLRSE